MSAAKTTDSKTPKKPPTLLQLLDAEIETVCGAGKRYGDKVAFSRVLTAMEKQFGTEPIQNSSVNEHGLSHIQLLLLEVMLEPVSKTFSKNIKPLAEKKFAAYIANLKSTYSNLPPGAEDPPPGTNEVREYLQHQLTWEEKELLSDPKEASSKARVNALTEAVQSALERSEHARSMSLDELEESVLARVSPAMHQAIFDYLELTSTTKTPTLKERKALFVDLQAALLLLPDLKHSTQQQRDDAILPVIKPAEELPTKGKKGRKTPALLASISRWKPGSHNHTIETVIHNVASALDDQNIYYDTDEIARFRWHFFKELMRHAKDPEDLLKKILGNTRGTEVFDSLSSLEPQFSFQNEPSKADELVKKLGVPKALQDKAARCLLGIPFELQKNLMPQMLEYAETHHEFSARMILEMMRIIARLPQNKLNSLCTQNYKLTQTEYRPFLHYLSNREEGVRAPSAEMVERLGRNMGCKSDEDMLIWRQLVLGVAPDRNHHQDQLDICFIRRPDLDLSPTRISPHEKNPGKRKEMLKAFFDLLQKAYGFGHPDDLASHIAKTQGLDKHVATELGAAIGAFYKKAKPHKTDEQEPDGTKGIFIPKAAPQVKGSITISKPLAKLVANFAFANNTALNRQCMEFLSSPKYELGATAAISEKRATVPMHRHRQPDPNHPTVPSRR